ncbi:MAG TPA: DUF6335 family protein [Vicinamibacterales bacterium]|nr:DUF6335 family protein [Vicinamibacterales bacterium]
MAKRKAAAPKRKAAAPRRTAARKPTRKAVRKASKPATKRTALKAARAARPAPRRAAKPAAKKAARVVKAAAPKARPKFSAPVRPKPAALSRERRQLREEEMVPTPPSTLDFSPKASSAETGQNHYNQKKREHTEGGTTLTSGDLDADWNDAYSSGEETPGGDMPTPDQDVVEEIGRALGVEYEDAEELKGADKIESRDRHRWEFDPASAEDYRDRNRRDDD